MSKLISVTAAFSLLICLHGRAYVARAQGGAGASTAQGPIQTRVYLRKQCLLSESALRRPTPSPTATPGAQPHFIGALAAIFVPILVEKLLGGVSSALKKAGADETLRTSARLPTYLYQVTKKGDERKLADNPDLGCLIIVRGTFNGADSLDQSVVGFSNNNGGNQATMPPPADGRYLGTDDQSKKNRISRLVASNIPVTSIATAYEAEIFRADDNSALRYESKFLEVNSFQGTKPPDKKDKKDKENKDKRGMVISIAVHGVGSKEGEPTLSLALMNLGEVGIGVMWDAHLAGQRSSWLGGVGMSEEALKSIEKLNFGEKQTLGVMPVTFEGMIAETRDGNKALKFIGEVLDATKADVTKTVSGEILKDREEEAKKTKEVAASAAEKLRLEEEEAYGKYLAAISALSKLENATPPAPDAEQNGAAFEVKRKKREWCVKYTALKTIGAAPPATVRSCTDADLQ